MSKKQDRKADENREEGLMGQSTDVIIASDIVTRKKPV
jgi:hypothetical protein